MKKNRKKSVILEEINFKYDDKNRLIFKSIINYIDSEDAQFNYTYIESNTRECKLTSLLYDKALILIEYLDHNNNIIKTHTKDIANQDIIETHNYTYDDRGRVLSNEILFNNTRLSLKEYEYKGNYLHSTTEIYKGGGDVIKKSYEYNDTFTSVTERYTKFEEDICLVYTLAKDGKYIDCIEFANKRRRTFEYDENRNLIREVLYSKE